jgi:hypothetical protein
VMEHDFRDLLREVAEECHAEDEEAAAAAAAQRRQLLHLVARGRGIPHIQKQRSS